MKKTIFKYLLASAICLTLIQNSVLGQQQFKSVSSASKLIVSGTSTVHDWEMEAENFDCEVNMSVNDNSITAINNIDFSCPVESIKSDNKIMDNKTYKALNSNKYPEINFRLANPGTLDSERNKLSIDGILTINNKEKEVSIPFNFEKNSQEQISVKGEIPLKMSDFGIDPPTAMLGTLKTGDEITVSWEILLEKIDELN